MGYAPDQGGPPPRPGSLQERQNKRDRARARRKYKSRKKRRQPGYVERFLQNGNPSREQQS